MALEAYEGATVTGSLNGLVIGDPYFQLTGLTVDPDQAPFGFIGQDTAPVVAAVPEPSTWAMMLLGFAGIGTMAYRRCRGGSALV